MFDEPVRLTLGLLTGILFGVLLQKGRVAKHGVIVGQLLLRDHTVLKIMLMAIAVGAVGFWSLAALDLTALAIRPANMGGVLLGALLFGVGLAVLGYCPGTTVAAVGEGRRDALAGLVGMVVGAFAFVRAYPALEDVQHAIASYGKVTLPDVTRVPPVVWIVALSVAVLISYAAAKLRRGLGQH